VPTLTPARAAMSFILILSTDIFSCLVDFHAKVRKKNGTAKFWPAYIQKHDEKFRGRFDWPVILENPLKGVRKYNGDAGDVGGSARSVVSPFAKCRFAGRKVPFCYSKTSCFALVKRHFAACKAVVCWSQSATSFPQSGVLVKRQQRQLKSFSEFFRKRFGGLKKSSYLCSCKRNQNFFI
jgi:hypothetical protein